MTDYTDNIEGAYAKIAAKGGVITFKQPPQNTIPADPTAPWEGSAADPEDFAHVAVLLPLGPQKQNAESNHRVLIPAYNLPFEITMQQEFTDDSGRTYAITAVTQLSPDPAQVILYDCECALWPAASE